MVSEDDVRRIVREELGRSFAIFTALLVDVNQGWMKDQPPTALALDAVAVAARETGFKSERGPA